MALSKKRAPLVSDPITLRIVQQVYADINEIIDAVNQGDTTEEKPDSQGKTGDIRFIKDADGEYFLEAKSDEGWVQSTNTTASGFKFKERS
jgi:hypothetical protein